MTLSIGTPKTQRAFFALLKAGLWEKDVQLLPFGEIDFEELLQLAEEQSVVGLIAAGLEHVVDIKPAKKDVLQFAGRTIQLEQRNLAMNQFVGKLILKMRKHDIYAILVKGQGVAQCYERPYWRTCGDVDLFLSDSNYDQAKALLTTIASSDEEEVEYHRHLGLTVDGWVVELHGSLRCGLSKKIDDALDMFSENVFNKGNVRSWDCNGVPVLQLAIENDILYVFTHFLNHFYRGGIGLRQICDWTRLLWTYRETIDRYLLESKIRQMGLMTIWKGFAAFAVYWLGMPVDAMPFYSSDARWTSKAERIKDFILEVGNFGHNRDMSYYSSKSFLVRKTLSLRQRIGDLLRHGRIFPKDSLRFFWGITVNGIRMAWKDR